MVGITAAQAQARLDAWLTAESALETAQSFTHKGRSLTRANLGEIREQIEFWEKRALRLSRGGPAVSRIVVHD